MNAIVRRTESLTAKNLSDTTFAERFTVSVQWILSGTIIAALALLADMMFDGMVVAAAVRIDGEYQCAEALTDGPIIATLVTAVVTSAIVGYWLVHMRKWIGGKDVDHDPAWTSFLRSRYLFGSMAALALVSPVKLIVLLSYTACYGHFFWV